MASIGATLLLLATLPLSVLRPWIGVLVFLFVCFATPQRLLSGFAHDLPFAKIIFVAVLCGLVRDIGWPVFAPRTQRSKGRKAGEARWSRLRTREVYLLVGLAIVFVLSTCFTATHPERAWDGLSRSLKILLMAGVTLTLFDDRRRLRLLLFVISLSIGVYGIGGGLWVLWTAGQQELYGPAGTFLNQNNFLGFAVVTVLPILVFLRRCESSPWIRNVLLATFALSIVAVLGTYSRGSLINLGIVLTCILVSLRTKDLAVLAIILATPVLIWLAPPRYHARVETVAAPQKQRSVQMRFKSQYVAWRLGLDHPVLGAGFQPFDEAVYERYLPGYRDFHNAHNHFLQMFAEHGILGLALYTALIVSLFLRLFHTLRRTRGDPGARDLFNYANALFICFVAYVVGGMFIGQPYFEPFYQLAAAAVLISQIADSGDTAVAHRDATASWGAGPVAALETTRRSS